MADAVRRIMEDMVPELEDLQKRGLASAREVRQLAKRRERLEYAIAKPGAARDDFLRYLQLELNLASLVACRRKRLSMPRRGASDWNIRKRVHFIFHRATRRFKGDERLWLQWADYCERTGAAKRLGRVYAQALSMLPACARLWVKAAAWEMDGRHNAGAARRLLQRGLRVNAAERSLWLAYFRFELLFLLRVSERRELLGLAGAADNGDAAAAEEADDDDDDDEEDEEEELMRELERIKKERAAEAAKRQKEEKEEAANERDSSILQGNPLLDPSKLGAGGAGGSFAVKRRWDDDVVFKNQSREPKKEARRFINDTVRNDFHKRFLNKYVK